jgi:predicted transcriptional regulator
MDLSFDREATRAATDARQVDLKDRRQRIQEQLLDLAERSIERAQSRYLVHGFSHTGESVAEWLQEPPARETKDLTTAATQALNGAVKLAEFDAEYDDKNLSAIDRFLSAAMGEPKQDE